MLIFEKDYFSIKETFKSLNVLLLGKAKEKNLELIFTCDEDVSDILLGDRMRLAQIINNLTGNAIKFTEKGKVQVHAKIHQRTDENTFIEFSVKDTGIGISQNILEHIFQRFWQGEYNTTREYGGTGLGLSIAKKLVALQGGTLSVKSELKKGSVFSFCIPYKESMQIHTTPTIVKVKLNPLIDR